MSRFTQEPHDEVHAESDFAVQDARFGGRTMVGDASNISAFPERRRTSGPSNTQVLIWSILGIGALSFLAMASLAPNWFQSANPADAGTSSLEQTRQDVAALSGEVSSLKQMVDTQAEQTRAIKESVIEQAGGVEELRRQVTTISRSAQGFDERLASLESQKGLNKQSNRAAPVQPATTQNAAIKSPAEPGSDAGVDGLIVDEPVPTKNQAANPAAKPKPIAKVVPPTPLVPKTSAPASDNQNYGVELLVSTSPEALRLNWEVLNEQHQALLKGLQAKSSPAGDNFRLLAGPFATAQLANAACAKLKQRGQSCKATPFIGNAL